MKRALPVVVAVAAMIFFSGCGGSGETAKQSELARTCTVELARSGVDPYLLGEWAKCPELNVRAQVARNPATPIAALVELAADSSESVQRIVAGRTTDATVLLVLAQSEFVSVRRALLSEATPRQVFEVLADDPDDVVSGNARYFLEKPVRSETEGATLSLTISQIEYTLPEEFLMNPSGSYCRWYGGTTAERTVVDYVQPTAEILRVNILGDEGSIIASAVAQPVGMSPEGMKILEENDSVWMGLYALTIPFCLFRAEFPDLPHDQNSYTVQVLADKVPGFESKTKKTLTGTEIAASTWQLDVTIP